MARSSKVQSSVHAIAHVVGLTLLLAFMQPIRASAQDGGLDTGASNVNADSVTQTKQIPKPNQIPKSTPKITYLPSSKYDFTCGSGKRATLVKYSDGEKVGETEKKCIPKSNDSD